MFSFYIEKVNAYLANFDAREAAWLAFGFFGQFLFMMRFVLQWIKSERQKRSVIPVAFWYFSIGGGVMVLIYALHRVDPVIIAGQALGIVIYVRNLLLIHRNKSAPPEKS